MQLSLEQQVAFVIERDRLAQCTAYKVLNGISASV